LQGNCDRFFEPHTEPDGRITVRPVELGLVAEWQISRHREQDQFKKQGLLVDGRRPRFDVLRRSWRCPDSRCTLYDSTRGGYVLLPRIRRGRPTCEIHASELIDTGPRVPAAQVKVLVEGFCAARFSIPAETEMTVGRAPVGGISLAPWLDEHEIRTVSRSHFILEHRDGTLLVRDDSTNGTRITFAGNGGRTSKVLHREQHALGLGDVVSCTDRVGLTRSGRRFPSELMVEATRVQNDGLTTTSGATGEG
jgi:hypothetical protein